MNLTQATFFISGQIAQSNTVSASLLPVPQQRVIEGASGSHSTPPAVGLLLGSKER